jgi:hypothetical protein
MEIYHYENTIWFFSCSKDRRKKCSGFWLLKSWVHEIGKLMSVVHIV